MSVLLKGGTIVSSTGRYVADVYTEGDKIKSIGAELDNPAEINPDSELDASDIRLKRRSEWACGTIGSCRPWSIRVGVSESLPSDTCFSVFSASLSCSSC